MALVSDNSSKGVWIAPGAPIAGTHALIVGVSSYPFLSGGTAPKKAPNSGGLAQLEVSARTAACIFDWLRTAESVAGAPVSSCRLLLSPIEAEKAEVDRLTEGNYAAPNFEDFRAAIEAWRDAIYAARNEAQASAALFFFSGHGVEHLASPALLAADILNPDAAGSEARAVAIEAVTRAIKTSGVDRALFFVDACRNAPALAMMLNIVGQEIIKPVAYPPKSPDAVISLQSTRSGLQSFQVPGEPATIFGQAILEGLHGPPPSYAPYDVKKIPWCLRFASLESYVKNRVRDLLAAHTAAKIQPVEPSGIPYNAEMIVAERSPAGVPSPPTSGGALPDIGALVAERSDELLRNFTTTFSTGLGRDRSTPPTISGELSDFETMHEILRHESVTLPFLEGLSVLDGKTGLPFPIAAVRLTQGRSSERGNSLTAWLDIDVPPGPGQILWIGLSSPRSGTSFAVAIPRDLEAFMPVRLDVGFRRMEGNWDIESLTARLAEPHGTDEHSRMIWRPLWELQRIEAFSDLGSAGIRASHIIDLRAALYEKGMSPVGAAIAAATLIRCGNLASVSDWPKNLADRFGWLPDGATLWAETLLRRIEASPLPAMQDDARYTEAFVYFMKSFETGFPLLGATLKMALNQLQFWSAHQPDGEIGTARSALLNAAKYLVSGSLFASFLAYQGQLDPSDISALNPTSSARDVGLPFPRRSTTTGT